jgi:DNA-directed RNA polymerase subunit RPC12/RpoP
MEVKFDLNFEKEKKDKKIFCDFCNTDEHTYIVFENKLARCKKCNSNILL